VISGNEIEIIVLNDAAWGPARFGSGSLSGWGRRQSGRDAADRAIAQPVPIERVNSTAGEN